MYVRSTALAAAFGIINWAQFPAATSDFLYDRNKWTPSNQALTFHKLNDLSVVHCDIMLDALTSTSGSVYAGIFVDGVNRASQALAGAPATVAGEPGIITFAFSNLVGGLGRAGYYNLIIEVAVEDNSLVTFLTTEMGGQCYELMLPPRQ